MTLLRTLLNSWPLRVAATFALLAVVVWRSQPQHLTGAASRLGAPSLLVAAALTIPFLYLKALRWFYMLRFGGAEVSFRRAAASMIGGMGVALLTPARVGELARIAYLPRERRLRLSGLVMLDKLFDVLVLVLLSTIGAWTIISPVLGLALAVMGLMGLAFVFAPHMLGKVFEPLESRVPLGGRASEVLSSLESLSPGATALYLLLTLGAFALVIVQFGLILHGVAVVSPRVALLTFPLVILTNIVPITIAGLGVREGAAVLLLGHFHVVPALAAVSAFAMFFLNTALPGVFGAVLPLFRAFRFATKAD